MTTVLWNQMQTDAADGLAAETIEIKGYNGDSINAYFARPTGAGPYPGVVLIHHLPGWDELYREFTRRFAAHGYLAISPNLYARHGQGTPDEMAAKVRAAGGVSDDSVLGDAEGAAAFLRSQSNCNGKVGVIGSCSGGRHTFMVACRSQAFQAAVELWGGGVVQAPQDLTPNQPVAPIDMTKDLACPLLGLFGNEDQRPSPAQVDQHEEELKKNGKEYEFHRYDGAGHGFFYYDRGAYRQEQAMDGWKKIFEFYGKHLA
jgi:carboxymethylenebutenolidase